jgi:hypothetical protein
MKGTPETPQCGFSRATIQILGLQGVDPKKFVAFNDSGPLRVFLNTCKHSMISNPNPAGISTQGNPNIPERSSAPSFCL